jgi:hypothetical protein
MDDMEWANVSVTGQSSASDAAFRWKGEVSSRHVDVGKEKGKEAERALLDAVEAHREAIEGYHWKSVCEA